MAGGRRFSVNLKSIVRLAAHGSKNIGCPKTEVGCQRLKAEVRD
jgi:hypothetical protein